MSAGKRPGGLTALAVFNFIFAFFSLLEILGMALALQFADEAAEGASEKDREAFEAFQELGPAVFISIIAITAVSGILLTVSGIGYLKLSNLWGRMMGNAYALLAIVTSVVSGVVMPAVLGGGFNLMTIIGFIYPALTLLLLNVQFKKDFEA